MKLIGSIELPPHKDKGGFDHAAIHHGRSLLYVAHTANGAVDVIDISKKKYSHSIDGLTGVAGALVNEKHDLVFTSNRGEATVGVFSPSDESGLTKIACCARPNGLSFDEGRGILLAAGVSEPYELTILDSKARREVGSVPSPGRTRWTVYDKSSDCFYVNVGDPAVILVIPGSEPTSVKRTYSIPASGPHGLDIDSKTGRLFCACDAGRLICLDATSGVVKAECSLSGTPDVIWFNPALCRLYVAVGDPGVIDVIDTDSVKNISTVQTEKGAHTTAIDLQKNMIYAFLPESCRAAVYLDE